MDLNDNNDKELNIATNLSDMLELFVSAVENEEELRNGRLGCGLS